MYYPSATDWQNSAHKRIVLFGMSGLGKTYISNMLRQSGEWFHYSADYRIGTRYMGEYIADNATREAMKNPFLRELLMSDSISIESKITFENLTPMASYLGKPGNPDKGGLAMEEYRRRQTQFEQAEVAALAETGHFIDRAVDLYGYPHFVCDSGGSICEWVDADNPNDPLLTRLSDVAQLVWIKGTDDHTEELIRRFDRAPKPMSYNPDFLTRAWAQYLQETGQTEAQVDPDAFIRWTYAQAMNHRQPRYQAMADNWGITIAASDVATVRDQHDFNALIASALPQR
jgi:hypothetical protein